MDIHDFLKIKIIEADGLDYQGISPTAMVEMIVGQNRHRTREVEGKSFVNESIGIKWKWNEPPFIFSHVLYEGVDTILIQIYHVDVSLNENALIGSVAIQMDTFYNSPKIELDEWYDVTPSSNVSKNHKISGRIRLQIYYNNEIDEDILQGEQGDKLLESPNLLQVTIHSASDLPNKLGPAIEAVVEIEVGDLRKHSKASKRSANPQWNDELIEIPIIDGNALIEVSLRKVTQLSMGRNLFIGRTRIAMNEVAAAGDAGLTKSYTLLNEHYQFSDVNRGELNLTMKWVYDKATDDARKREASRRSGLLGFMGRLIPIGRKKAVESKAESEGEEKDDDPTSSRSRVRIRKDDKSVAMHTLSAFEQSAYLEEQRGKRSQELQELLQKDDSDDDSFEMPDGDYTIQVHVIEVAELKGLNSSGFSDPIVYVEIMNQVRHTRHVTEVDRCTFNEVLYFNFKDLKQDQLASAHVKISVYDWNRFRPYGLTGVHQVDLMSVYQSKDHELYREWAGLRDVLNKDESGEQGLLKYSIVCLGSKDNQKIHDPNKDEDVDENEEDDVKDLSVFEGAGLLKRPSDVKSQRLQFLVVSILKADGLPGFDRILSAQGLYTYITLDFAGCKPVKTTKVSVVGKQIFNVHFNEELWIPVWVPTFCKRATLTIMNREFGRKDQVIATYYIDYDSVREYDKDPVERQSFFSGFGLGTLTYNGPALQLLHLYGANPSVRGTSSQRSAQFMNSFPNFGSSYRGSILASLRIIKQPVVNSEIAHKKSIDYEIPESLIPSEATYFLRAMIYQGSDFGSKGLAANKSNDTTLGIPTLVKYRLGIQIGKHEFKTNFRVYENGYVDWVQLIEINDCILPKKYEMLPDTFLTVYRGTSETSNQSVAFKRLKTVDLLPKQYLDNDESNKKGPPSQPTNSTAQWYELEHDLSHRNVPSIGYPGAVLLKLFLCNIEDVEDTIDWEPERRKLEIKEPYCLKVHIYQCKDLPSVHDHTIIDPYVKIRFCGQKQKTEHKSMTQFPSYYETLEFHQLLPKDLSLAPHIIIQIWNKASLSSLPVAAFRQSVSELPIQKSLFTLDLPTPTWHELHGIDGKKKLGSILCSFQLFKKNDINQAIQSTKSLVPTMKNAYLDIHTIGVRHLLPLKSYSNIKKPYLRCDISGDFGTEIRIESKRTSSKNDYNFLNRDVILIQIPEDPLFAPTLEIRLFDTRTVGPRILLGHTNIPLNTKIPWNIEDYIPPRQHEIMQSNIIARKKQSLLLKEVKDTKRVKKNVADGLSGVDATNAAETGSTSVDNYDENQDESAPLLGISEKDDLGVGVFPISAKVKDISTLYADLPKIMDEEEIMISKKKIQEKEDKDNLLNLKIDPTFSQIDHQSSKMSAQERAIIGFPTAWSNADFLVGREDWIKNGAGTNLEDKFQTLPFENYDLFRGHISFNKFRRRKNTMMKVGLLKAVVRVCAKNPRFDEEYNKFYKNVKKIIPCEVRVYIIKAQNLQPVNGSTNTPDPYLMIELGPSLKKDFTAMINKKNASSINPLKLLTNDERGSNPQFFKRYDLETLLPGPSLLKVSVMDRSKIGFDKMIGETVIDLEDRWYHDEWTSMEKKQVEMRTLHRDGSTTAQGVIMLWVDIYSKEDGMKTRPIDIMGPENRQFEIRIVCWKSMDVRVVGKRSLDLFAKFYMEGEDGMKHSACTDTHWWCKDGKASWNWRIKLPIELPLEMRELGRLQIQLWNQSVITSNEVVGAHTIDLYDWLMLCYYRQTEVIVPKEELKKAREKISNGGFVMNTSTEPPLEDLIDLDDVTGEQANKSSIIKDKSNNNSIKASTLDEKDDKKAREEEEAADINDTIKMINLFLNLSDDIADDAEWVKLTYKDRKKKYPIE
eukprot:gene11587-15520_t